MARLDLANCMSIIALTWIADKVPGKRGSNWDGLGDLDLASLCPVNLHLNFLFVFVFVFVLLCVFVFVFVPYQSSPPSGFSGAHFGRRVHGSAQHPSSSG